MFKRLQLVQALLKIFLSAWKWRNRAFSWPEADRQRLFCLRKSWQVKDKEEQFIKTSDQNGKTRSNLAFSTKAFKSAEQKMCQKSQRLPHLLVILLQLLAASLVSGNDVIVVGQTSTVSVPDMFTVNIPTDKTNSGFPIRTMLSIKTHLKQPDTKTRYRTRVFSIVGKLVCKSGVTFYRKTLSRLTMFMTKRELMPQRLRPDVLLTFWGAIIC